MLKLWEMVWGGRRTRGSRLQIAWSERSIWLLIAALAVSGLIATLSFTHVVASLRDAERGRRVEDVVDKHATVLRTDIERLESIEIVASAFFAASREVTSVEFEIFARSLIGDGKDLLGVMWVPRVEPGDREEYFRNAEARGLQNFAIRAADGTEVDPTRLAYPTWYSATSRDARAVAPIGLDWGSIAPVRLAMATARDTGQVVASGALTPWLNHRGRPLCVLAAPIFSKGKPLGSIRQRRLAIDGFVLSLAWPEAILLDVANVARTMAVPLSLYLLDVTEASAPVMLGQSVLVDGWVEEGEKAPSIDELAKLSTAESNRVARLRMAGREWRLIGVPVRTGVGLSLEVVTALGGGIVVTALLCGLVWAVIGRIGKSEGARLQAIYDSASDGIVTADDDGSISSINLAGAKMFGWKPEEIIGRSLTVLMPERYRDAHSRGFAHYLETGEGRIVGKGPVELTGLHVEDGEFPIDLALGTWTTPGGHPAFAAVLRDSTGRLALEQELVAAKEQAEAASQAKSEFLAKMSHELRTPLNAIVGIADLMRDTELSHSQISDLEQISLSADSLLRLVSDILDISRIEAGQLELAHEPFSLRTMVENSVQPLIRRAQVKGIEMACRIAPDVPDAVKGDSGRLQQIFLNLIGNAIKFTEHGKVEVEVVRASDIQNRVEIEVSVKDTGPGIALEQQTRIFDIFVQGEAGTKHAEGVGLGLATAAQLVQMMGGRIWVESALGTGSTFRFRVTLDRDEHGEVQSKPSALQGSRVLIVDDNPMSRRALEEITNSWGMLPTSVANGKACIDRLRAAAEQGMVYHLLLLDFELPGQNGIDLARTIREDASLPNIPGLLLSSSGNGVVAAAARKVGLVERLEKPVARAALRKATMRALNISEKTVEAGEWRASRTPLRILLAEDNPINQAVTSRMLTHLGHKVRGVSDGKAAVQAVESETFDLVLMDYDMPVMDGLEASKTIRSMEKGEERLPIVALTAYAMEEDRKRLLAAGVNEVLTKPVRIEALASTIDRIAAPAVQGAAEEEPEAPADQPPEERDPPVEEVKPSVEAGPSATVIDMGKLVQLGGDATILDLIVMLEGQIPEIDTSLADAIEAADADRLRLAAHTLKGSLALFGATEAVSAARKLEEMGRQGQLEGAGAGLEELRARLRDIMAALAPIKNELAVGSKQEGESTSGRPRQEG